MISEVLRDVLVADAAIAAALGTYEFTTGLSEPAIFTTERIPDNCMNSAIIIDDLGGTPWGDRCKRGGECSARIRVYGDKSWELDVTRALAWDVNRAIDRAALDGYLASYGYAAALCQANPPAFLPDPDGFPGFMVDVRVIVQLV